MVYQKIVDYTYSETRDPHSFIYGNDSQPPPSTPVVSIVSLEFREDVDVLKEESEDRATWQHTLNAIAEEPGWRRTFLGQNLDNPHQARLFIGWQKLPPQAFAASTTDPSTSYPALLSLLPPLLRSPPRLLNVPWQGILSLGSGAGSKDVYELVILDIPAHLDPAEHEESALKFRDLHNLLTQATIRASFSPMGDLADYKRGWAMTQRQGFRTHAILLGWESRERELLFKAPNASSRYHAAPEGPDDIYKRWFLDPLEEMVRQGMKMTSVHLKMKSTEPKWDPFAKSDHAGT